MSRDAVLEEATLKRTLHETMPTPIASTAWPSARGSKLSHPSCLETLWDEPAAWVTIPRSWLGETSFGRVELEPESEAYGSGALLFADAIAVAVEALSHSVVGYFTATQRRTEPWLSRTSALFELAMDSPAELARDATAELREVGELARLSPTELGPLFGASRRSVYNWLAGRPINDAIRANIFQARDALAAVAATRDPILVRTWLDDGDPSPATLIACADWQQLREAVHATTVPVRALSDGEADGHLGGWPDEPDFEPIKRAALLAFADPATPTSRRRPQWQPREDTGLGDHEQEEDE